MYYIIQCNFKRITDYSIEQARENKFKIDWQNFTPKQPENTSLKVFKKISIKDIIPYIDWKPFFEACFIDVFEK